MTENQKAADYEQDKRELLKSVYGLYRAARRDSDAWNETDDCGVIAVMLAARVSYAEAHKACAIAGRVPRHGMTTMAILSATKGCGAEWKPMRLPRRRNGARWTATSIPKAFPTGRFMVFFRTHVAYMEDGAVIDWTDGRRFHVQHVVEIY